MENDAKIELLREFFDVDWESMDAFVADDSLSRFVKAVVTDGIETWYDDDLFIDVLMDNFSDDHPVWQFISIE